MHVEGNFFVCRCYTIESLICLKFRRRCLSESLGGRDHLGRGG